jgi:hypothetical protein
VRRVRVLASAPTKPAPGKPRAPTTTTPVQTATSSTPPAGVVPTEPPVPPPAEPSTYWGAWVGPQFTGQPAPPDMSAVPKFEALTHKPLSLLEAFSGWKTCPTQTCDGWVRFPTAELQKIRSYGAIPMYSWASEGSNTSPENPEFALREITDGKFDTYIREWAEEAKAWGHPFFLRFDWEMNGNWFPWGSGKKETNEEPTNGNEPGDYIAAWRHVHNIFTNVGATNATWVWCPFMNPGPNAKYAPTAGLYPGDEYVDWTCMDGYNAGTSKGGKWKTFPQVFSHDYGLITGQIAPEKPMLLAEVASTEKGANAAEGHTKAGWIEEMFTRLPTEYPKVRGFLWFDYFDQGNDWPLETESGAVTPASETFAKDVAAPRYLGNSFAALPGPGPVPLP